MTESRDRRPLRVLLVDPAPMHRSGLRMVLTTTHPRPTDRLPAQPGNPTTARDRLPAQPGNPTTARDGLPAQPGNPTTARDRLPAPRIGDTAADHDRRPSAGEEAGAAVPEIVVVAETGDGAEAVDLARRLLPDVLITELALPRLDGLSVCRQVSRSGLPVRVLVLTADDGDEEVLGAIAAGAGGFLCKDAPPAEVIAAVHAVAAGGAVITPAVLARILTRVAEVLPAPETTTTSKLDALTDREREVLIHVARGHSNAEIAEALRVSETTIKTHVGHMLTKLRLRDRTQAVVLAYETGLVKPGA